MTSQLGEKYDVHLQKKIKKIVGKKNYTGHIGQALFMLNPKQPLDLKFSLKSQFSFPHI
jgi:hypothetical protein